VHLTFVPEWGNIADQDPLFKNLRELCMAAANEQEPKKLMTLVTELINVRWSKQRLCA
jgi:hypothetical protein